MKETSFFANTAGDVVQLDTLRHSLPAVFAKTPHASCSARYGFIDSQKVVNYFLEEGFRISEARGGRRGGSQSHGMHTVRLRAPFGSRMPGDLYPEVVFSNSHDRTSRGMLDLGVFRTSCANGLVVATSAGLSFNIPHIGDQREAVLNATHRIMEFVPQLSEVVTRWSERRLSVAEVGEFNRRARIIIPSRVKAPLNLTEARRPEDADATLWNVFNRVQENALKGGVSYVTEKGKVRNTRALGSVRATLKTNKDLWELAEEFLPA